MFNYFKTESGKITTKILAVLLIITLTFVNFIMLGTHIVNWSISIAAGEEPTSENNVIFSVYLDEAKTLKETKKDINAEDLKIYVSVQVKNQGTLENAKINLDDTNFYLKEDNKKTSIDLGTIQAGQSVERSYEIVAKKDAIFNLSWLNMDSTISLTGTYVSDSGNKELTAENEKNQRKINLNFDAVASIDEEDNPNHKVELNQDFITNEIVKINNNEEKRVVQQEIISKIVNNSYPIKATSIDIEVPKLGEEYPESVKVATFGTAATNGKYIEFGTKEEGKAGTYEYDEENHLLKIEVKNNPDENNFVSWEQEETFDDFIVTYIYGKDTTTTNVKTKITSKVTMYTYVNNSDGNYAQATISLDGGLEEIELEPTLGIFSTPKIYKGNMKIGEDTEFATAWQAGISDIRLTDSLVLSDDSEKPDKFNDEAQINVQTIYKTTYINVEEMNNMLGENGEITITYGDNQTIKVNSSTEKGEGEYSNYYKVTYPDNINKITMQTSRPVKEGTITIINYKALKANEELKQNLSDISSLTTCFAVAYMENNEIKVIKEDSTTMEISNTKTNVEFGFDKKEISTTNTTDVNFTVTLVQDDIDCNLFKAPVITIELPSFIKTIANISKEDIKLLNADGTSLSVASVQIDKTSANPKIIITLSGESTSYGANPQVNFKATLGTDKIVPTMEGTVKLTVTPEGEEVATVEKSLKATAENKIITATTVKVGEEDSQTAFKENITLDTINSGNENAIPVAVTETIINNIGTNLSNISVIGKIEKGLNAKLLDIYNGDEIFYTTDNDVNKNSNWIQAQYVNDIELHNVSIPENATGYKVVFASINNAETKTINLALELPEGLEQNKTMNITYSVINGTATTQAPIVTINTPQETNLELTVVPSVEDGKSVYEGSTLTYNVTVKNTGNNTAKNINVVNSVPQGTTLATGSSANWVINSLEPGEEDTRKIELTTNMLDNEDSKQIKVTTKVTQEYMEEDLTNTVTNIVVKSPLEISVELLNGLDQVELGNTITYYVKVKNVSGETIDNLKIENIKPEELEYTSSYAYLGNKIEPLENEQNRYYYNNIKIENNQTVKFEIETKIVNYNKDGLKNNFKFTWGNSNVQEISDLRQMPTPPSLTLELTSNKDGKEVKTGDIIEYNALIKNDGTELIDTDIEIKLPDSLEIQSIDYSKRKIYVSDEVKETGEIYLENEAIGAKGEITFKITAMVIEDETQIEEDKIISFDFSTIRGNYIEKSNTIQSTLKKVYVPDPIPDPDPDPDPEPEPGPTPDPKPDQKYTLSGKVWLDENKDGKIDENEKGISDIKVNIKDAKKDEFLKDENDNIIEITTNKNGEYEFTELKAGKYILVFDCDVKQYGVTSTGASFGVIATEDDKTFVKTDTIEIKNKDINNINIGLVENPKFDLQLDKYITKVSVQNVDGTTTYEYDKTKLAKVEISAKKMAGSVVVVEYTIDVTNKGEIPGYANTLVDYVSPEYTFSSELNTNWYEGSDKNLYCLELANEEIEPGETKSVKLVLTKTMTNTNTGLITNTAEIEEDFNEFAFEDVNSKPGNKEQKENDMSTAEVIIGVKTGGPILYIGIFIISMLIMRWRNLLN